MTAVIPAPADRIGTVKLWYGRASQVPPGWRICDGSNGTPNLVNRFLVGAGGENGSGQPTATVEGNGHTGGSGRGVVQGRTLANSQMPAHGHGYTVPTYLGGSSHPITSGPSPWYSTGGANTGNQGGGGSHDHGFTPPAWAALYPIMRVN